MDDARPFDATESYLCDAPESAMGKWHTTSLVTALKGILNRQPRFVHGSPAGRVSAFRAAADELTRRGLDASSLVRYGMWDVVASSILNALAQSTVAGQTRPGGVSSTTADVWWTALDLPERPTLPDTPAPAQIQTLLREIIAPSLPRIMGWISTAPIDSLLEMTPPSGTLPDYPDDSFPEELQARYAWAVDHFSSTFYSEWSTSSLHYAYRWLSGHEIPPCNPDLMCDRRIESDKLNAEIARRAATRKPRPDQRPMIDTLLANEMVEYAISLLKVKRFNEAAAIFEFAASQKPYDGYFQNNLGFCLIPSDPQRALVHLRVAAEMNYPRPAVNVYNQMCCHIGLRRIREALALAGNTWTDIQSVRPHGATLWKREEASGDWVIFYTEDDRMSVAELAIALAHEEGRPKDETSWRERQAQLGS
jgi:hypothetical protein